jgi:predicted metalloprotease
MRFNPKARLDSRQVEVRRGGGGGGGFGRGGGGMPIPMGVGGGVGGVILLIVILVLSGAFSGGGTDSSGGVDTGGVDTSGVSGIPNCQTGDDANKNDQCALVAEVNSIQSFWDKALPDQANIQYQPVHTVFFSGQTGTGCGGATSDVGPFYCPVDKTVYLDTTFFHDMLQGQLGARGGPFSEAYVLAHEYGHHIQDELGTMGKVRTQQGPTSDSVRLELQADCYGGMWAKYATTATDANGQAFIEDLTKDDYARAIDAAQAVGDDRIQQRSSGRVNPEQWTHGSAAARVMWFETGLREGTLSACDTFHTNQLYPNQ